MSEFLQFASERGLIIDHLVYGKWARVPTVDHPHKKNGAYWFGDEFGHCQNWALMDRVESWSDGKERTPAQQKQLTDRIEASRVAYANERKQRQLKAAEKASWILSQAELRKHPYLDRKGFPDLLCNTWRDLLVIPMRLGDKICGCQMISADGEKKFLTGQRTNDSSFRIGNGTKNFIVEGYASGLSLNAILRAINVPASIHVSFSCGNAARIAKTLPDAIWIADHDKSGAGQTAAKESGLKWWMPEKEGDDINDFYLKVGLFKSSQAIKKFLTKQQG